MPFACLQIMCDRTEYRGFESLNISGCSYNHESSIATWGSTKYNISTSNKSRWGAEKFLLMDYWLRSAACMVWANFAVLHPVRTWRHSLWWLDWAMDQSFTVPGIGTSTGNNQEDRHHKLFRANSPSQCNENARQELLMTMTTASPVWFLTVRVQNLEFRAFLGESEMWDRPTPDSLQSKFIVNLLTGSCNPTWI